MVREGRKTIKQARVYSWMKISKFALKLWSEKRGALSFLFSSSSSVPANCGNSTARIRRFGRERFQLQVGALGGKVKWVWRDGRDAAWQSGG